MMALLPSSVFGINKLTPTYMFGVVTSFNDSVVYFTESGCTRRVAQTIAEATGATLHELKAAQPYTSADLDWRNPESIGVFGEPRLGFLVSAGNMDYICGMGGEYV